MDLVTSLQRTDRAGSKYHNCKVVVIGAGVSGLSAAHTLIESGFFNVTVIEATNEVGGRLRTINQGLFSFDSGAQWIYGNVTNPMWEFIKKHNLHVSLNTKSQKGMYFTEGGIPLTQHGANIAKEGIGRFEKLIEDVVVGNATPKKNDSVMSYVKNGWEKYCDGFKKDELKILNSVFQWMTTELSTEEACDSLQDIPLAALTDYHHIPGLTMMLRNGYQSLALQIKKLIPAENIHFNSEVTCIDWNRSGLHPLQVNYCTEGENRQIEADHVIVTIPLGFLKEQHHTLFRPPLPQHKASAIQRIGFGVLDKVIMYYNKPFWKDDVDYICTLWDDDNCEARIEDWQRSVHCFHVVKDAKSSKTFLLCWIAGETARFVETLSDEEIGNGCHEILLKFAGINDLQGPSYVHVTRWHSDKYTRGSFSYRSHACKENDRITLSEPLPPPAEKNALQLLFAGEATHPSYYATVHGAFLSGEKEANRIIDLSKILE